MTTYNFMSATKVADLDMMLVGIKDYIFGDLAGETLTEECLEELNEKFARVDEIIDSCKDKTENDVKEYERCIRCGSILEMTIKPNLFGGRTMFSISCPTCRKYDGTRYEHHMSISDYLYATNEEECRKRMFDEYNWLMQNTSISDRSDGE